MKVKLLQPLKSYYRTEKNQQEDSPYSIKLSQKKKHGWKHYICKFLMTDKKTPSAQMQLCIDKEALYLSPWHLPGNLQDA